jgi:ArsR family transcriptional regulator
MAFHKSHLYPKDAQIISGFAKAIGHSARVTILRKLAADGPCNVKQIALNHPISRPALSVHLKILRSSHLIKGWEKFPHTFYELDVKTVTLAKKYLGKFLREI